MVCIHCSGDTQVTNSRHQKRTNQIWRRRQCVICKSLFTTQETADFDTAWRVRDLTGRLQPFSRDKLFLSLFVSCQHRKTALKDAGGLSATVIAKLQSIAKESIIDRRDIIQIATLALNRFDKAASTHYQAFHRDT